MVKLSIRLSFHWFKGNQKSNDLEKECISSVDFISKAWDTLSLLESCRAKSTVDNYKTALRSFAQYAGENVAKDCIDRLMMEGYQKWLVAHGISQNCLSCYMRSLRSLMCQVVPGIKDKGVFDTVFTGRVRTEKRAINIEKITMLRQMVFPQASPLQFSCDIFLFSVYAMGMPFVDIAFLQKRNIHEDYIVYHRHKTGQRIRVKIAEPMRQIIDKYVCNDSPFVFPILTISSTMTDYESARSKYNRHLKEMGRMIGLRQSLTSYVARHSWASIAYHSNIDISVIAKALGHTSPHTTLTYISEIDDSRIDSANEQILGKFCF